jgi:hypothetical protein
MPPAQNSKKAKAARVGRTGPIVSEDLYLGIEKPANASITES